MSSHIAPLYASADDGHEGTTVVTGASNLEHWKAVKYLTGWKMRGTRCHDGERTKIWCKQDKPMILGQCHVWWCGGGFTDTLGPQYPVKNVWMAQCIWILLLYTFVMCGVCILCQKRKLKQHLHAENWMAYLHFSVDFDCMYTFYFLNFAFGQVCSLMWWLSG